MVRLEMVAGDFTMSIYALTAVQDSVDLADNKHSGCSEGQRMWSERRTEKLGGYLLDPSCCIATLRPDLQTVLVVRKEH